MKKETKFAYINTLEKMAREFRTKNISEEDIEKDDITAIVLNEIPYILKGEIFNMSIQGKTKSSKSTLMIWFLQYILRNYYNRDMELWNICAEQFEFIRRVTDHNIKDTVMGIDEYGAMETSGANSTIEEKMLEQFSDLQAQRNIHRIFCSPRKSIDMNSNIILKIMAKSPATLETHCLVYYRVDAPNGWYIQLIGRATFDVSDILFSKESWKRLQEDYPQEFKGKNKNVDGTKWGDIIDTYGLDEFEETKGPEDKNGKRIIQKPFGEYLHPIYYRYRKRKFLKMDLLNKEGISHMRDMVFADITLYAYNRLEKICGIATITKDNIEAKINMRLREIKYPLTIYAMEVVKGKVASLISDKKTVQQLRMKMIKTRMGTHRQVLNEAIKDAEISLKEGLEETKRLIEINRIYNEI